MPIEVTIEGKNEKIGRGKEKEIEIEKSIWIEEEVQQYHEKCEGWICTKTENGEVWKELEEKVKEARVREKRRIKPWRMGRRECTVKSGKQRRGS